MVETLQFSNREAFRTWLSEHCLSRAGVWLLFSKDPCLKTITAMDALEEALCFGWIDGQMKSIDDTSYMKYFSLRRENSKWSEKNKALVQKLEQQGILTEYGRQKIQEAKQNGQWDSAKPPAVGEEQIAFIASILEEFEPAHSNFMAMSPSVQKTYTRAYLDAKTDAGQTKRLNWMIERLTKNLKPM